METFDSLKNKINSSLFYSHQNREHLLIVDDVDKENDNITFHWIKDPNQSKEIGLYGFNLSFSKVDKVFLDWLDGEKIRIQKEIKKLETLEFAIQHQDRIFKKFTR